MKPFVVACGLLFFAGGTYTTQFQNVAAKAGLTKPFPNGGDKSNRFIIETTGSGAAFLDFDNDGFTDLFVTYWGQNYLYCNIGGQRFEDVTERAGLKQDRVRYNTGCAFLDCGRDGHADLFVANYLKFDPETTPFTDVSAASGVSEPDRNYSLGVLTGDFNNAGLVDIYVACDQTPSLLYINQGNGQFAEEAVLRGVAFDENGKAMSGWAPPRAITMAMAGSTSSAATSSDERETLYRNCGHGDFDDATVSAGIARNTRYVGWGCGFFDYDNDGWKDLLLVNGHVFPEVERLGIDPL